MSFCCLSIHASTPTPLLPTLLPLSSQSTRTPLRSYGHLRVSRPNTLTPLVPKRQPLSSQHSYTSRPNTPTPLGPTRLRPLSPNSHASRSTAPTPLVPTRPRLSPQYSQTSRPNTPTHLVSKHSHAFRPKHLHASKMFRQFPPPPPPTHPLTPPQKMSITISVAVPATTTVANKEKL